MTVLGLFFAGSVLFVNGLSLLVRIEPAAAAPVNAFVGLLLLGVVASVAIPVRDLSLASNRELLISSVGFLLFAFTYVWVAINHWTGAPGTGLGWYCLWAAGVSMFLAIVYVLRLHDPKYGVLWALWAVLFTLFFAHFALGQQRLAWAIGWATTIEAVITTTIPAALMLLGEWPKVSAGVAIGVGSTGMLVITLLLVRSSGAGRPVTVSAAPITEPPLTGVPDSPRRTGGR